MAQQFPFGQALHIVHQTDRSPKRVFVLGAYASAVHARWIGTDGKDVVQALAVASEPYIFWKGQGAADIIKKISMPPKLGKLQPAEPQFNGPSGIALDERILGPLGLTRADAWLCNLVPHSCVNVGQQKVIAERYTPLAAQYGFAPATIPQVPEGDLADATRIAEIIGEMHESKASILILLGDQPMKWFLSKAGQSWKRLSMFKPYGRLHPICLDGMNLNVLPLVHPRQAVKQSTSSDHWFAVHDNWVKFAAGSLLK